MTTTMPSITGHFTMLQTVMARSPRPTASPMACATGPLTTSPMSTSAAMTTRPR